MNDDDANDDDRPRSSSPAAETDLVVRVEDSGWGAVAEDPEALVGRAVAAALAAFEPEAVELAVVLSDDATVRALNGDHRGKDYATNVLSFAPAFEPPEGPRPLGDVILALGTVLREAGEQGKTAADHLSHLVVHGVLHLSGLDHETDADAEEMEQLERAILAGLGIADPYADPDTERAAEPAQGDERAA